jgi:hypothetical protein
MYRVQYEEPAVIDTAIISCFGWVRTCGAGKGHTCRRPPSTTRVCQNKEASRMCLSGTSSAK